MNALKSPEETGHNIDGFVNFVLKGIEGDAKLGQVILELGGKTKLAQAIEQFAVNPLQFTINNLKNTHKQLLIMVDAYIMGYFTSKASLIENLYKYETSTGINYFLILNEDNTENREVFFDLLDHYETLHIINVLPINISFLPKEAIGQLDSLQELEFAS